MLNLPPTLASRASMDCKTFRRKHLGFVDDTLSGFETSEMRHHLVRCAECARHDATVRKALLLARNLPQVDVSETFASRLAARLEIEKRRPQVATFPRGPGLGLFSAIAACLIGIGVLTVSVFQEQENSRRSTVSTVAVAAPAATPDSAVAAAFVSSMSTGMPVWQALWLSEHAPAHFVAADAPVSTDAPQQ